MKKPNKNVVGQSYDIALAVQRATLLLNTFLLLFEHLSKITYVSTRFLMYFVMFVSYEIKQMSS